MLIIVKFGPNDCAFYDGKFITDGHWAFKTEFLQASFQGHAKAEDWLVEKKPFQLNHGRLVEGRGLDLSRSISKGFPKGYSRIRETDLGLIGSNKNEHSRIFVRQDVPSPEERDIVLFKDWQYCKFVEEPCCKLWMKGNRDVCVITQNTYHKEDDIVGILMPVRMEFQSFELPFVNKFIQWLVLGNKENGDE